MKEPLRKDVSTEVPVKRTRVFTPAQADKDIPNPPVPKVKVPKVKVPKVKKKTATKPNTAPISVMPVAQTSHLKTHHRGMILSFALLVLLPVLVSVWYLYVRAVDQYTSTVGFVVRSEEFSSPIELLGGLGALSSSGSSDTDVVYEFIQSQHLISQLNEKINLKALYSKPKGDPIFSFSADGAIEDLVDYWSRMVKVYYDSGTGLINIRTHAFTAVDAQQIAQGIFEASSVMINALSDVAREDATKYAQAELDKSVARLKTARSALTQFRNRTQIVDPTADIMGQVGLLSTLQAQLAETFIEFDLLIDVTRANDPRIEQAKRKIEVIKRRITEERKKFGLGEDGENEAFAQLVGQYEALVVDREFAEKAYLSALSGYDVALADAQHQSRYLAAYTDPTLAETAQYPQRLILLGLIALFLSLIWAILTLIAYSIRDRR